MSANQEFIEYIRDLLSPLGELENGAFFGGYAIKRDSKQFAMIMGSTLYFCVNDQTRPKYQAQGMECFAYNTKKRRVEVKKYYTAPPDLFEDTEQLIEWAREAIQSAHSY